MKATFNNKLTPIILLLLAAVLFPLPATAQMYEPFFVWNQDGAPIRNELDVLLSGDNPVNPDWSGQTGDLVQVIYAGVDGIISPPDTDGNPTGDDQILATSSIGWGTPWVWSISGCISLNIDRPPETNIYTRVFNAPTLPESSFYGDSTIFIAKSAKSFPINQYGLLTTDQPLDAGDDDGDGLNNSWEKSLTTDPIDPDSDGDGLLDGEEKEGHTLPVNRANLGFPDVGSITFNVAGIFNPVTEPKAIDTDGDTYSDYNEVVNLGSDPRDPDSPGIPPPPSTIPTPTATATPSPSATPSITNTPTPVTTPSATPTPSPQPTADYLVLDGNDFDGDGTSEIAIYRAGLWVIQDLTRAYFGNGNDRPASGDYNGDGTSDITIFRKSSGLWAIRGISRIYFGTPADLAAPADYNGSNTTNIAIYRPAVGLWAIRHQTRFYYGCETDAIIPADFNGDGSADPGIFRETVGLWAIRGISRVYFGREGDNARPVDYDGDDIADIGIFRQDNGLWAFRQITRCYFGSAYDIPVCADYTGAGMDEIGIFRPTSGLWAIRGVTRAYYGNSSDILISR
jgi:thrombospondin type 3 repeat protein